MAGVLVHLASGIGYQCRVSEVAGQRFIERTQKTDPLNSSYSDDMEIIGAAKTTLRYNRHLVLDQTVVHYPCPANSPEFEQRSNERSVAEILIFQFSSVHNTGRRQSLSK